MRVLPRRSLVLTVAALLALPGAGLGAEDGVEDASKAVFKLDPDAGVVRFEGNITLRNAQARNGTAIEPTLSLRLPLETTEVRTGKGSVLGDRTSRDAVAATYPLTFKRAIKPGKQRTHAVGFELTSIPWLPLTTRVAPDYARFCWFGLPTSSGSVEARIPAGWTAETTGAPITTKATPNATRLSMPRGQDPGTFRACTDAFLAGSVDRVYVLSPDEQLITIDAWGSDLEWKDAMSRIVATDLGELRELIGVPMPLEELRVQEVTRRLPLLGTDDFRPDQQLLYVDEGIERTEVATVALARTWFNASTIAEPGLEQGLALWSGLRVAGQPCPMAPAFEPDPPPTLAEWSDHQASLDQADILLAQWQGSAACDIVGQVAEALGPEATTQVIAELLSSPEPADWSQWLASVEWRLTETEDADPALARALLAERGLSMLDGAPEAEAADPA